MGRWQRDGLFAARPANSGQRVVQHVETLEGKDCTLVILVGEAGGLFPASPLSLAVALRR